MAYSDYGGYAFRNGVRVEERSDFTVTPEGGFGTPGCYPGFAVLGAGGSQAQAMAVAALPSGHAVLGDGPIFVTLYKQSSVGVYRVADGVVSEIKGVPARQNWDGSDDEAATFEVDGHKLTIHFTEEDNFYCYAQLEQPDGVVWHGWSGYGVGAGLEEAGYGYSTPERTERCAELFGVSLTVQDVENA